MRNVNKNLKALLPNSGKQRFLYLTGVFVLVNLFAGAQNITLGIRLLEMEQWNKANLFFREQYINNLNSAVSQFYLGESFLKLGQTDSSEYYFLKSEQTDPKYMLAVAGQGMILLHQGNAIKARECFDKAIKRDKKNTELYAYISEGCLSQNDTALAKTYLSKGMDISVKNSNLHLIDAKLNLLNGDAGKAANSYERAIYYDKQCTRGYTELGQIYYNAKNYQAAVDNLSKALVIDSLYVPALKKLGDVYYWYSKYGEASQLYSKYFRLSEVNKDDYYRYAYILYFNKEYEKARQIIESLIVSDPQNAVLLRLRAYISYDLGVDEKGNVLKKEYLTNGLQAMNLFFTVEKDKSKYLANDFEYWAKLQQKCECGLDTLAAINYIKAFQMDSTKIAVLDDAVKIYTQIKQQEKAAYCYSLIIKKHPDDPLNYYKLGKIYYNIVSEDTAQGDTLHRKLAYIKADSAFKKVAELVPNIPLGYLMRARNVAMLDPTLEAGLAKPFYEKTIQIITADSTITTKYKRDLMESYRYLGYFYIVKAEASTKINPAEAQESKNNSIAYWNKLLELNPNDSKAREMLNMAVGLGLKKK